MVWQGPGTIFIRGTAGVTPFNTGPINPGDLVTVNGYTGSTNDVFWDIYDAANTTKIGQSVFHLSCSDSEMNGPEDCGKTAGDAKGTVTCSPAPCVNGWTFEGMAGAGVALDCAYPGGSAAVTYVYEVTNNTADPVTGVMLSDAVTHVGGTTTVPIAGPFDLGPNETRTFEVIDSIGETTTNVATALACGLPFQSNQVTVNVPAGPSACPTGAATLTVKDRDVKWKITAPAGVTPEISSITIDWPVATNGALTEVHLQSPKIASGSFATSPTTITSFSGAVKDRTLEAGKTEELKFKFANKAAAGPYSITVGFVGGCSVSIP